MTPSDVRTIVDNLDNFLELPDGIERLRKAVLTLAVSGNLVEQDPADGTAEELYKDIQKARAEAEKSSGSRARKQKELPPITEEEIPFEIPKTWKWVRLGNVVNYAQRGKGPKYVECSKYPVISQKCVRWNFLDWSKIRFIDESSRASYGEERILVEGDLLLNSTGTGTVGRVCIYKSNDQYEEVFVDSHVTVLRVPQMNTEYIFSFLESDLVQGTLESEKVTGSTNQKEWSLSAIKNELLPLPPINEQKRIANRVIEIMSQLDELEARNLKTKKARSTLTRVAMKEFGLRKNDIAINELEELVKSLADVDELENAVLTLAVSGNLVEQDPADGTAEELYKDIQKARAEAEKSSGSRARKQKELPPITEEEIPFEIPKTWKWVRLEDIVALITDGEHISPEKYSEGVPLLSAKNVTDQGVTFDTKDYVLKEHAEKFWNRCSPSQGDLLICSRGTIGRTAIVDTDCRFVLMGSVILVKFFDKTISDYVRWFLKSDSGKSQIGLMQRGTAVSALYLKDIRKAVIPLPPTSEAKKIIEKIHEAQNKLRKLREILAK